MLGKNLLIENFNFNFKNSFSDDRTTIKFESKIQALTNQSLSGKPICLVVEEIDGIINKSSNEIPSLFEDGKVH